ncbi:MAG: hypothetical protein OHK0052_05070 [Anaerolineales bacterium]
MENSTFTNPSPNRSGLWALLGVLIGFSLPVLLCGGLAFFFFAGLGSLGDAVAGGGGISTQAYTYESGPLTGPAVAIIPIRGAITSGTQPAFDTSEIAASDDIIRYIKNAAADAEIKAIVLDVNSPGGGVVPSDEIYHALQNVDKPIVVIMRDLAASGGYYVSMAADKIYATPNTLTGSIGVISQFPNAEVLLEKVGVEFTVITSGNSKDFGSLYREMKPEEIEYWRSVIGETYENFVAIVAKGRNLPVETVRPLADGSIYTAQKALEYGLIDEIGYSEDAIAKAAELAGISGEPRVVRYGNERGFGSLFGAVSPLGGVKVPANLWQTVLAPSIQFRWLP